MRETKDDSSEVGFWMFLVAVACVGFAIGKWGREDSRWIERVHECKEKPIAFDCFEPYEVWYEDEHTLEYLYNIDTSFKVALSYSHMNEKYIVNWMMYDSIKPKAMEN